MNKKTYYFLSLLVFILSTNSILGQKVITSIQGEKINTTSAQGDNTSNIATMDFVHTAIGSGSSDITIAPTTNLTLAQSLNSVINVSGFLTGNAIITINSAAKRTWIINNQTSGSNTITIKYAAGAGVTVAQGKSTSIYGDGTNVKYVDVSSTTVVTDAIADGVFTIAPSQNAVFDALVLKANLDSPTFTGAPTTPTVSPTSDNSIKLANTAFVQGAISSAISSISASSHVAATVGTPDNGLTVSSGQVINLGLAGASTTGALSSTDWNSFSTKEPALPTGGTLTHFLRGDKTWQTLNTDAVAETATHKYFTDALARAALSLTATGNSGAATYNNTTGVLNIPTYTLAGLGAQAAFSGDGFIKISGTTISYDNTIYAPLASPNFTGTPSLPSATIGVTQPSGTSDTTLATTAFVATQVTNSQMSEEFNATANQLTFGLTSPPIAITALFINGQRISTKAITFVANTATYIPAQNNGTYNLSAEDIIIIQYAKK